MAPPVQPLLAGSSPRPGPKSRAVPRERLAPGEAGAPSRETLREQVTGTLRDLLISGRLAPGEKLSLRSVAESLSVSMMPVREAVARLAADGALEVLPGRAVRVPVLTLARFDELTRIRLAVEGYAVEEAARSRDEADLRQIAGFERAFQEATDREPPASAQAVCANRDLHFAVYHAARLPMLTEIIERLWLKVGPVLNLDMRDEPRRLRGGRAVHAHAALVAALRGRDPAAAREALETDIRTAAQYIVGIGRLGAP